MIGIIRLFILLKKYEKRLATQLNSVGNCYRRPLELIEIMYIEIQIDKHKIRKKHHYYTLHLPLLQIDRKDFRRHNLGTTQI